MRAINHAMTGAIIGLAVTNPVALPLAFASHYFLDTIPHHGLREKNFSGKIFKLMLLIDILLCLALAFILAVKHPNYWWLAVVCAFLAASPDFMWLDDFISINKGLSRKESKQRHSLVRLHSWIQWFERPVGLIVEAAWAMLAMTFLFYLIWR